MLNPSSTSQWQASTTKTHCELVTVTYLPNQEAENFSSTASADAAVTSAVDENDVVVVVAVVAAVVAVVVAVVVVALKIELEGSPE